MRELKYGEEVSLEELREAGAMLADQTPVPATGTIYCAAPDSCGPGESVIPIDLPCERMAFTAWGMCGGVLTWDFRYPQYDNHGPILRWHHYTLFSTEKAAWKELGRIGRNRASDAEHRAMFWQAFARSAERKAALAEAEKPAKCCDCYDDGRCAHEKPKPNCGGVGRLEGL